MNTKAVLCVLIVLALLSTGCAEYANYTPSAAELAVRETQQAQATRQSLAMVAKATSDALALSQQGTIQSLDAQATAQALTVEATAVQATFQAASAQATATREAQFANATATREAVNANATATVRSANRTATAQSANATATATREAATATAQAALDNAQATAVQATAASVARQEERERITQPLRTFGPWLLLLVGTIAASLAGYYGWRLFEDRARLVRRNPDEGEPIMLITRERMALPLRQFGPYADLTQGAENAPLLAPSAEYQSGTTMRQQTANAIQARQVGAVARAKSKAPVIVNGQAQRPPSRPRSRNRVSVPGLVKVVAVGDLAEATAQGILPPRLAKEIEGQWTEVQEEVEQ